MFNLRQEIVNSFKHCTFTIAMDGSEDLLIHWLKHSQPYAVTLDWHQGLHCAALQERQDPSEIWRDMFQNN